ncbi:hypothetical protein Pfo_020852 [Paulownia fortunei]|nr:hypothetical protein Pfo_020852 [Paulownia fortunei]
MCVIQVHVKRINIEKGYICHYTIFALPAKLIRQAAATGINFVPVALPSLNLKLQTVRSGGGGGDGDHRDGSDSHRRKKRYHRHTAHQIQMLEAMFKECAHPDEKTRNQLSRELNLNPRQIKFWFQNRRTQMKAQHERADNYALRADNDRIRCENIAMREALRNVICPSCGSPPVSEDSYFDEQKLRMENAHMKEEFGGHGIPGPSLDLDLLHGSSSSVIPNLAFPPMSISDMDKSLMTDIAANAMDELIRLLQSNEPLWMKLADGRETLNLESYERIFQSPCSHLKNPNIRIEASRDSGVVIMNGLALVDMFMDANKWVELFPTIVSRAKTIEVISSGMLGSQSGALQLMYEELQVLSALVPTRQFYFLRFCQQIEQGSWAIVDISYDIPHQESQFSSSCKAHRLPSGCLIQDMPNGYSKVTWVEHWRVEDKEPIHRLYRDLIHSGLAFGAERWLSLFKGYVKDLLRMVNNFCSCINPSNGQQWTTLSGLNEFEVRATLHKSTDPGRPNGVVLSAAATIWLPIPPQNVFNFFRDERTRPQWDVLSNQNPVQEVAHIANGSHPGNCISVLRAFNTSQNNMLILQESCIDSSGSLVVYCPVDLPAINIAMSGEDPSYIPLLPSGFTISPDGRPDQLQASGGGGVDGASTSSNPGIGVSSSGSLITVVFQILVSNLPSARMSPESVTTVNNLISNTVHHIKAALNCSTS